MIKIREASKQDLEVILSVERAAFNSDEEANLVKQLMEDESAKPFLSLIAFIDNKAVGHILFTKVSLNDSSQSVKCTILAPLAVIPEFQKQGIGSHLVEQGLQTLKNDGFELVFLAGYPQYYSRFGFKPASILGFNPPYPMPQEYPDAWMVLPLKDNLIGSVKGDVVCANTLNQPEYWKE
jgi:putative acetyltransferase